ncbi:short-chain dehydrogenase/reductase SDR [Nostoc commune NIES-4072]|uniref:Short-chain dehydrogenase/reductase SDR n=1 Tax=Nostoc commune NIES-4072 TaxID=2005467 RepID=A0A2R5FXK1_NOSCO|nr:SDR family oxidoreductase [Nostoc commune]BBD70838.1 short-chain dehydrogenase/reductase SDR [Nostoc commune HK-02]GBG23492.1 short-chain dehydrogenase/reductase SDR [Nostoc commune NIES-4072]
MLNVENKVIAITGASSGIGEATAKLLAQNGANVVLGARRTEKLEAIVKEIRDQGNIAEFKAVDLRYREDVKAFIHFAKEKFGRVDVIFNNAGVMPLSPMNALKVEEWDTMIDVNIRGVLNGIAAGLPIMEAQGGGQFINTASIAAHMVGPTSAVYSATKYAVWAISDGLRQESKNIRVTIISPGVVETELGSDITDDAVKGFLKELRKTALTPQAIAQSVLFAVSQPDDVDVNEIIVRPTASAF